MARALNAGQLKHRIKVEKKDITGTGVRGQPIFTWEVYATAVPAHIEMLSGRRLELAKQLLTTASHNVTIRYLEGLTEECKLTDESGQEYNIGAILNEGMLNFQQVCVCTTQKTGP
jgi:SPP1 family predicted phage head-tail adaptor